MSFDRRGNGAKFPCIVWLIPYEFLFLALWFDGLNGFVFPFTNFHETFLQTTLFEEKRHQRLSNFMRIGILTIYSKTRADSAILTSNSFFLDPKNSWIDICLSSFFKFCIVVPLISLTLPIHIVSHSWHAHSVHSKVPELQQRRVNDEYVDRGMYLYLS